MAIASPIIPIRMPRYIGLRVTLKGNATTSDEFFIDAGAILPNVPPDLRPAGTLAAELYVACGARCARNLVAPGDPTGATITRLAVRTDRCSKENGRRIIEGFERVLERLGSIRGLRPLDDTRERFEPV